MSVLLRIDAGARTEGSHSRCLADEVQARWQEAHPDGKIIHRDLARQPVDSITEATITGFYTPPEAMNDTLRQATAMSDALLDEVMAADSLLIATPMYNFGVPAVLKAWIDQVVRINRTFANDAQGFHGLLHDKRAYVTTAFGARYTGSPAEAFDFLRPYLRALLGFIGYEPVEIFSIESTTVDPQHMNRTRENALRQIEQVFLPVGASSN